MANYFADVVAPELELVEDSIWKSAWDWLEPKLLKAAESWLTYLLGTAFLVPILAFFWSTILKHWGYLFGYKNKVEEMRRKMESLEILKDQVEDKQREAFNTDVVEWVHEVNDVRQKANGVPDHDHDHVNLLNLYFHGKVVGECISKIDSLLSQQKHNSDADPYADIRVQPNRAQSKSVAAYEDFKSRNFTFTNVMKAFEDKNIRRIAIWGFGGVGKTTMKNKVKEAAENMRLFNYIIDVDVGIGGDNEKVQQKIQGILSSKLKSEVGQSVEELSEKFNMLTKDGKTILIILDNVWEKLDLKLVGLSAVADGNDCFKLLLTTRDQHICRAMDVEDRATFEMEAMSPDEAWLLLQQLTNIPKDSNQARLLHHTGLQIVELCGRLPIAIKFISESLKLVDPIVDAWTRVLRSLEGGRQETKVFDVINDSYKNLSNDCQQIFLLCCFFPPDGDIPHEKLVRYVVGLRLFEGRNGINSIMDIRDEVHGCIGELKSTHFLQDSKDPRCVKMHDLVRDFGIKHVLSDAKLSPLAIAAIDHGDQSQGLKKGVHYTSVSLKCSPMSELPSEFPKSNLKFLKLVGGGDELGKTPEDFYVGMQKLEVLAYENIKHPLLPGSQQQYLSNLRSLSLDSLQLGVDIRMIGNLSNLEILSFADSGIEFLPEEIGKLSKLRLLDLNGCKELRIHDNVLGRLQRLEELYMRAGLNKGSDWQPYSQHFTEANLSALGKLSENLQGLDFDLYDDVDTAVGMKFEKLKRFRISVGGPDALQIKQGKYRNTLRLALGKEEIWESQINVLFKSTEVLHLKVWNMISISDIIEREEIQRCQPAEEIMCSFKNLRKLKLEECHQLESGFGVSMAEGLKCLESLKIIDCRMMEEIVGNGRSGEDETRKIEFPSLRILSLKYLPQLVGFGRNVDVVELPLLEELNLDTIPNIKCIFPDSSASTSAANGDDSSSVQCFFKQQVRMPKLDELQIRMMDSLMEIWPKQFHKESFRAPRRMDVAYCHSLENVFPANMIGHLDNLEDIRVYGCSSLEELFKVQVQVQVQGGVNDNRDVVLGCRKESSIGSGHTHDTLWKRILCFLCLPHTQTQTQTHQTPNSLLPSFLSIKIYNCENLRHVFNPSIPNHIQLEHLSIDSCQNFKGIDSNELIQEDISPINTMSKGVISREWIVDIKSNINLSSISHSQSEASSSTMELGCNEAGLVTVLQLRQIPRFCHLKELKIRGNNSVEVIFDMESVDKGGQYGNEAVVQGLNDLKDLDISNLQNMTHVWKGWKKSVYVPQRGLVRVECFQRLTHISLWDCNRIEYLFTPLIANALVNLKGLEIKACRKMDKIVSQGEEKEDKEIYKTYQLENLQLCELENLKCMGGGTFEEGRSSNSPSSSTPFPPSNSDKKLERSGVEIAVISLCNSTRISMTGCDSLSYVIPSFAVKRLEKLEELFVIESHSVIEVFQSQGVPDTDGKRNEVTIKRLRKMVLKKLKVLECIWRSSDRLTLGFPMLKELIITDCPNLTHVFSSSTVDTLWSLESLEISDCKKMEVIVKDEDEGRVATNSAMRTISQFTKLKFLKLNSLESLSGISSHRNAFSCPLLETTDVGGCPKLAMFISSKKVIMSYPGIAQQKLGRPGVEIAAKSLCNYTIIKMVECNSLSYAIPSSAVKELKRLEELHIGNCVGVREVFQSQGIPAGAVEDEGNKVIIRKLRKMVLEDLGALECIWWRRGRLVLQIPLLKELIIKGCPNLTHVFNFSTVDTLQNLQFLNISDCKNLEVIVKDEDRGHEATTSTAMTSSEFRRLESLLLENLESLSGVSEGKHAFICPFFVGVYAFNCPRFAYSISSEEKHLMSYPGIPEEELEYSLEDKEYDAENDEPDDDDDVPDGESDDENDEPDDDDDVSDGESDEEYDESDFE